MFSLTLQIAWRTLFSGRKVFLKYLGGIVILGLMLGVLSQSVAVSILSGFEKAFKESILAFNAHLVLMKDSDMPEQGMISQHLEDLKSKGELQSIAPFLYREGLLAYHSKIKGVVIKGVPASALKEVYQLQIIPENALDLLAHGDKPIPILIGQALYEELKIQSQDPILSLLSAKADLENIAATKNFERFKVVGTFSSGLYEFDSHFIFLGLQNAQDFYEAPNQVSGFEMQVPQLDEARTLADRLNRQLGMAYKTVSWDVLNADIFASLRLEKILFFLIMGFIVLIASFNLVGLVTVLFSEQKEELSLLRALGFSLARLKTLVALESFILSLIGIFSGLGLSALLLFLIRKYHWIKLPQEVYLLSELPLEFKTFYAIAVVLFALLLSLMINLVASFRMSAKEIVLRQ